MNNIGLVLEGGGLRGVYTAGVLDYFLDKNIEFGYCIGASAGVCNAVSYISKQKYRSRDINLNYVNDKHYLGIGNLLKTGSIFGYKMMLDTIPHQLMPFDYHTYENSKCVLTAAVTNCETGKSEYYRLKNLRQHYDIVQATTSLPLISKMVNIDNKKFLDGGVSDSIPIRQSINDGNQYNVVVLTRDQTYRKKKSSIALAKIRYGKYPNLIKAMENRWNDYNNELEFIEKLEQLGKIFVFRPSEQLSISRLEKDVDKLSSVYDLAVRDSENKHKSFMQWLEKTNITANK